MDSLVEAKVVDYLRNGWRLEPYRCGALLEYMRTLARVRGFELDDRFASAGLGVGPEAAVASSIVNAALHGGATPIADDQIRRHIDDWLRRLPAKGSL